MRLELKNRFIQEISDAIQIELNSFRSACTGYRVINIPTPQTSATIAANKTYADETAKRCADLMPHIEIEKEDSFIDCSEIYKTV